ncbi:3-oxoacyl-ACP synthase III [Gephyromycinifex aptenodytis]|uniref:3-oxoacyl-ACP synthase III n=1 Tax=Gephyromycinifex aptenodytis TaxID=2716227 RepID=UPI001448133E|nr:3-oxoacyl-ACP synthase III [Gephyromycinifex aptenodytis]
MSDNATYRLANTTLLAACSVDAPEVITSEDLDARLAPAYERFGLKGGRIEGLAGVAERRWWPKGEDYTDGAIEVGRLALQEAGVDPDEVGLLINASVTRPHLEPSIASRVHHHLGLPTRCLNFDITNACLGVVNALQVAGTMIDAGQIEYALIVASEGARSMQEDTIERLLRDDARREEVKEAFATMTLGSGAVGLVLARADRHEEGHRIIGGLSRAGTAHHELCVGSMSGMRTNSRKLFVEGLALATEAWKDALADFDWQDMDWYVAHQTSLVHIDGLCQTLGLDRAKFPTTIERYGNIGPAALPFTLAKQVPNIERGQRVLLMGIGSGLNTSFTELAW